MQETNKEKQENDSAHPLPIGLKIEELNNKIDGYNRILQFTGGSNFKFDIIEEIKQLHKEVKRMNTKLFCKRYRSSNQ